MITNSKEILEFQRKHFQNRYKKSVGEGIAWDNFSSLDGTSIDDLERDILEDDLTIQELEP